jgi:hypothetical protein
MRNTLYKFTQSKYSTHEYYDQTIIEDKLKTKPLEFSATAPFKVKRISNHKEDFLNNYGNILARVEENSITIVVEEYDDKLAIKLYYKTRLRHVGNRYFKVTTNLNYLTVNTKTKNIYHGSLFNYHKKRKTQSVIRKNYFVNNPVGTILNRINTLLRINFINYDRREIIFNVCDIFFEKLLVNSNYVKNSNPDEILFKYYLDERKIKYPNNFLVFKDLFNFQGVSNILKKNLKKNDYKLVSSIMKTFDLKGDIIKKTLHNINEFDCNSYESCVSFFGDKLKQDYDALLKLFNNKIHLPKIENKFSKKENNKIYKIFKELVLTKEIDNITFNDHLTMYDIIKNYGETDLEWSSNCHQTFRTEHLNWTEKISNYRSGTFLRIYPDILKNDLKPIKHSNSIYYPVLLESSKDYNLESSIQSNCVRTYVNKTSIIISFRKDSMDSEDRATLEYSVKKDNGVLKINRVQSLGKHNSFLDQNWNEPLRKLDNIIDKWLNKELTYSIIKKSNNGRETFSQIDTSKEMVNWDNKEIYETF